MDNLRMEQPGPLATALSGHHHNHILSGFSSPASIDFSAQIHHHRHSNASNNSSSSNYHSQQQQQQHHMQQLNVTAAPWLLQNHWPVETQASSAAAAGSQQHDNQISLQNGHDNHGICRSWDISDPTLQLTRPVSATTAEFSLLNRDDSVPVAPQPPPPPPQGRHSLCSSSTSSSFPQLTVSQSDIPYACKLDDLEGREVTFASLSRSFDRVEDLESNSGCKQAPRFVDPFPSLAVKAEVVDESSLSLKSTDGGGGQQQGSCSNIKKEQLEGGVTIASLEDGSIGLKLGKRTYYEDVTATGSGVVGGTGANPAAADDNAVAKRSSSSSNGNSKNSSPSGTAAAVGAPAAKKQKGSSSNATVPKCQAEGCKADLSGAKDYHRRHKVCEWHSKASKVKVANLEQRFCQQCSRFHVLSEFDEGKRSCRRRLAGHNERRRKPPPEPISLLSPSSFAYFADSRVNAALLDHPYFMQYRRAAMVPPSLNNTALACHLGLVGSQEESVGNGHSLELHHFMQGHPPGGKAAPNVGLMDEGQSYIMVGNPNSMALSHPSGPAAATPLPSSSSPMNLISDRQPSEVAISGRALSLLSSSLSSSVNPSTMSMSLGMASPAIDQLLVADNHSLASSHHLGQSSCFHSGMTMASAFQGLGHNSNHSLNSLTGSSSPDTIDQGDRSSMSNYEARSMFLLHPENGFHSLQSSASSQHGRPILDLMQVSSTEHQHQQQQQTQETNMTYSDLHELSIFSRQTMI